MLNISRFILRRNVSPPFFKAGSSKQMTGQFVRYSPKAAKFFCMIQWKKMNTSLCLDRAIKLNCVCTVRYKKSALCAGFKKRCT